MYHAAQTVNANAIEQDGLRAQRTRCASANEQFDGQGVYLFCDRADAEEFMELNCASDYVIYEVDADGLDMVEDPEYAEPGLEAMSMIVTSDVPTSKITRL